MTERRSSGYFHEREYFPGVWPPRPNGTTSGVARAGSLVSKKVPLSCVSKALARWARRQSCVLPISRRGNAVSWVAPPFELLSKL